MFETNLKKWNTDGRGEVATNGTDGFTVDVQTPLSLWCPTPAPGNVRIDFECHLTVENSAMLVLACAKNWKSGNFDEVPREGVYEDYNSGPLELYSVGFNRTSHVTDQVQPNASSANVRRIGGPDFEQYKNLDLKDADDQQMQRWHRWDQHSLVASICEPHSGINRYYHYSFEFACPKITGSWEGQTLFTLIDHREAPLAGGHVGLRCMTPGARFHIRRLQISSI